MIVNNTIITIVDATAEFYHITANLSVNDATRIAINIACGERIEAVKIIKANMYGRNTLKPALVAMKTVEAFLIAL